ncbi:MAG: hypothetical protein KAV87_59145, partial [Desulfobacteraceae bacterium]|nr:hypothetical protein [Desulfobacteraceae bacterium]
MKNYLSMGFGWNSVAYYIMLQNMGWTAGKPDGDKCFEAVFVNHGSDWPETYEYADYFIATGRPVTILTPQVNTVEKV